jgi:hypothetical protein
MFDKDYRDSVIRWYIGLLRNLNLSDKTIGFFVRAMHVHTPIYLIIAMWHGSQMWCVLILLGLFVGFAYFILFDGCVLSKLEQTLDHEDITIVDPFLEIANVEKTNKNRMRLSLFFGSGYTLFMLLIFKGRFYTAYDPNVFAHLLNLFKFELPACCASSALPCEN